MAKKPARKARPRPTAAARPKASMVRVRAIIDCAWDRNGAIRRGEAKDVHPEDAARLIERGHVELVPGSPPAGASPDPTSRSAGGAKKDA